MRSADRVWKISRHLVPSGSRDEQPSQGTARSLGCTACSCCSVGKEMITTQKRPYSLKATTSLKRFGKCHKVTSPPQTMHCMCDSRQLCFQRDNATKRSLLCQLKTPALLQDGHGITREGAGPRRQHQRPLLAAPEATQQHTSQRSQ